MVRDWNFSKVILVRAIPQGLRNVKPACLCVPARRQVEMEPLFFREQVLSEKQEVTGETGGSSQLQNIIDDISLENLPRVYE
jgi:hypothetical protein